MKIDIDPGAQYRIITVTALEMTLKLFGKDGATIPDAVWFVN